ncbi:MAG: proline--tRNA ligase [Alphaproteobacteria bacterium]
MRLSEYFLPTLKETPAEAQIASHRLMLRAGMVRQASAGIYNWLPLGLRVLKKIENIVRDEQQNSGAQEILMPTIQSADLWKESGRYEDYGQEMLRIVDRHKREFLYGPTNEEQITDITRAFIKSYKDLPKNLFQIQWKFRDEIRPRFGVMRGREFLMKDNYSFDLDMAAGRYSYNKMFLAYLRTFARLGLRAIPMAAESGPIGGDLSHEFIVLAPTGESEVFYDKDFEDINILESHYTYSEKDVADCIKTYTSKYAATDDKHIAKDCPIKESDLRTGRGIEVGHIFFFGDKYSKPMGAMVQDADGKSVPLQMGSYGIGVSRLVGAIIEASHDENGIIWPEVVAPFKVGLICLRVDDEGCRGASEKLYSDLEKAGIEVLYDDRNERPGAKFSTMDLIGLPYQVTIGPRGLEKGIAEVKVRSSGKKTEIQINDVIKSLSS